MPLHAWNALAAPQTRTKRGEAVLPTSRQCRARMPNLPSLSLYCEAIMRAHMKLFVQSNLGTEKKHVIVSDFRAKKRFYQSPPFLSCGSEFLL